MKAVEKTLKHLNSIYFFTKDCAESSLYDFLKKNNISFNIIKILRDGGVLSIHKIINRKKYYKWSSPVVPNIHMAKKVYNELNKYYNSKKNESIERKVVELTKQEEIFQEQNDKPGFTSALMVEIDKLFGTPLSEIEDKAKVIALMQDDIENLKDINTKLQHQLDYAKNVENREVQDELVKAMNLNSEKSLIIGNMAMQLDKKDDEIKLVSRLIDNNNGLGKAIMQLQETVLRQEKLIGSLNKTLHNITEKSNPPAKNFSILWGLLTIKNA